MTRILAIDFGKKRTGLAHSDKACKFAFPLRVVKSDVLLDEIAALFETDEYSKVVLGIPFRADGSEGDLAGEIRKLAETIASRFNVEIDYTDEAFSSKAAAKIIVEQGLSYKKRFKKRKQKLDAIAAQQFLQDYLDRQAR